MELGAVEALVKKAVGDKAKAVEVVAAKSVEEQVCAPKATITMLHTATGQKSTSSDTETVAKHKVVPSAGTRCRSCSRGATTNTAKRRR